MSMAAAIPSTRPHGIPAPSAVGCGTGIGIGDGKPVARSPTCSRPVEPGKRFVATATCSEGASPTLSAPGVSFDGATGTVDPGVAPGTTITVELTCTNAAGTDQATDAVTVKAPPGPPPAAKQAAGPGVGLGAPRRPAPG